MNEERARELQRYIKTLTDLQGSGFNCKNEIQQAIKELHKAMGFESVLEEKGMHIVVLENDFDGLVKSLEVFTNLLGSASKVRRIYGDDHEIRNGKITISIINTKKINSDVLDRYRGYSADYVINNSAYPIDNLNIRIKK